MKESIKTKAKKKNITQDRIVYFLNYVFLGLLVIVILYPLIYVLSASFSSGSALMSGRVRFLPVEFTLDSYKAVFKYDAIWTGYKNSIIYTVVGTVISVALTLLAAYPLSRDDFQGRKFFNRIFVFTMIFSGGLVPSFLLIQSLGLMDTMWAVILPGSVNAFNVIVARTFFKQGIPDELIDAAAVDGCSDFKFFTKIALPLSKAIIAVLALWIMVGLWNGYFQPMLYINSEEKYPLQLILRRILLLSQVDFSSSNIDPVQIAKNRHLSEMLKYATIIISTLPLMLVYPLVQKHFVKGVTLGSVKG